MRKSVFLLGVLVCLAAGIYGQRSTEGSLYAVGKQGTELGACPLKSTAVKADISGFISRVSVRQEFENSFSEAIEAVYVFPLSQDGAVDQMTMTVGGRTIKGKIMRREEAKATYEAAKAAGKTASLLDQERPNVFTQSVANIMPGERVIVEISYVETLKYEAGAYEFVFPMTVAPRYIPGGVKDAAKITPPVSATRNGSDISVEVNLNAGVPVEAVRSSSHQITQLNLTASAARITLRDEKVIPNKDFILRYDVTGKRIEDAVLTHRDARGGFFTLILQPPDSAATEDRTPKEIVFVLDTSGSMSGFPIDKAKEAMRLSLDGLYPEDTFNLITFAGDTAILFDKPVPATEANLNLAQQFLAERRGYGGTEMMKAIKAALDPSDAADHLRIVCFMTDAEVGNEDEIIAEIQRHPNARVFSFGIGSSVNRALLDKMAAEGKGEVEYVGLQDDGSAAAKRFYERVRTPLLTDLSIDWNGMQVADVFPGKLTDLFSAKPVILHGRYSKSGTGMIKLKGKLAGQPYERAIQVNFPEADSSNEALSTLWARTRIDELSMARLKSDAKKGAEMDTLITSIGLDFGLMTKFTSFVAVEERVSNPGGDPIKVVVPSVLPEGMDPANATEAMADQDSSAKTKAKWNNGSVAYLIKNPATGAAGGVGSGRGSGSGNGIGTGANGNSTGNGSGSGNGNGNGSGTSSAQVVVVTNSATTVDVTSDEVIKVDTSQTAINTNITAQQVQSLPINGRAFSSLLVLAPGAASPAALGGGFQIDGVSGTENAFVIDGSELTNYRTGDQKNKVQLGSRTIAVAEPPYPAEAAAAKALGEVIVEISVDRDGFVRVAKAVSGDKLLRASAEKAAMLTRFAPTVVEGTAVRLKGTIAYVFKDADHVQVFLRKMKAEPLSEEDKRSAALRLKAHTWIYQLVARLASGIQTPGPNEAMYVRNGKAEIQVELKARSADLLAKLKTTGFEMAGEKGKSSVVGRIAIDKLSSLAEIEGVMLILPKI